MCSKFHQQSQTGLTDMFTNDGADTLDNRLRGVVSIAEQCIERHAQNWKAFRLIQGPRTIKILQETELSTNGLFVG